MTKEDYRQFRSWKLANFPQLSDKDARRVFLSRIRERAVGKGKAWWKYAVASLPLSLGIPYYIAKYVGGIQGQSDVIGFLFVLLLLGWVLFLASAGLSIVFGLNPYFTAYDGGKNEADSQGEIRGLRGKIRGL
jgi:hypothetical protein